MVEELASYRRCVEHIRERWAPFLAQRSERLKQQERHGVAAEKVAENILEDLFTTVLDWSISDLNNQVGYVDLLLTRLGVKYLIVEVKRPGSLAWNRHAVDSALEQALRYAGEQRVKCVAVSDGVMLYAADVQHGGVEDRVFVSLGAGEPQEALWWLSVHGVYRPRTGPGDATLRLLPEPSRTEILESGTVAEGLLHPKYRIPARCFAYVGHAGKPGTWRLPFRLSDGDVDVKRLPKAIQSILSNYRGTKVSGIPERDIGDVLVRLGRGAREVGKMPGQSGEPAPIYQQLAEVLEQLGRLADVS